jgi:NAD(P)-dependent dehydrogenase (short-subunit alcohol dehydrogenase family)
MDTGGQAMRLQEKVAVVTGGGSGIGEATARLFAEEGARVLIVDRDPEGGERVRAAIAAAGGQAAFLRAELAREAEALAIGPAVLAQFGQVDILVNNAGHRIYGPIHEADEGSWDEILAVNVKSLAFCAKAVLPVMIRAGRGSIVNVSSANGVVGRGGMAQYDTTKAGVLGLTRSMANDYAAHGIRVNAVCPGPTLTQFHLKRAAARGVSEAEVRASGHKAGLLKRWAEPREIACGILFLASDEASYVTGISLMVDGGMSAT